MREYKLRLYRNHNRSLMFEGSSTSPEVKLMPATREIEFRGKRYNVVNQHTQPGELSLWLSSPKE